MITPMLAMSTKVDLDDPKWDDYLVEPKLDGVRAIVEVGAHGIISIYSRTGHSLEDKVPRLVQDLMWCDMAVGTILDGELGVIDEWTDVEIDGVVYKVPRIDFNRTAAHLGSLPERAIGMDEERPISFIAFDALNVASGTIEHYPLKDRITMLGSIFADMPDFEKGNTLVHPSTFFFPTEARKVYDQLISERHEGIMLKNPTSPYIRGKRRANTWYKFKDTDTYDVVVMGATEGEGKYEGLIGAIKFGAYHPGTGVEPLAGPYLHDVGKCSGMTDEDRITFTDKLPQFIEIKCNGLVGSGEFLTPRHPQFVRVRTDKTYETCSIEQFRNPKWSGE